MAGSHDQVHSTVPPLRRHVHSNVPPLRRLRTLAAGLALPHRCSRCHRCSRTHVRQLELETTAADFLRANQEAAVALSSSLCIATSHQSFPRRLAQSCLLLLGLACCVALARCSELETDRNASLALPHRLCQESVRMRCFVVCRQVLALHWYIVSRLQLG